MNVLRIEKIDHKFKEIDKSEAFKVIECLHSTDTGSTYLVSEKRRIEKEVFKIEFLHHYIAWLCDFKDHEKLQIDFQEKPQLIK